jgi:hypothetical protein
MEVQLGLYFCDRELGNLSAHTNAKMLNGGRLARYD